MEWKINPNAVNQFAKGTDIYTEGEPVFNVALILKGRVLIHSEGAKITVNSGTFLGINDLYAGKFQSTYTASDDLLLFIFVINRIEEVEQILSVNKDYHGFMVASYNKIIYELDQIYQGLMKRGANLYLFLTENYREYFDTATRCGYKIKKAERFRELNAPVSDLELLRERINFYTECRILPLEVVKAFYSYGNTITLYQVEDQVNIVNQQLEALKELSGEFVSMAEALVDESDTCLFRLFAELALEIDSLNGSSKETMEVMDNIIEEVNKAEKFVDRMLGRKLLVNRSKMEEVYHLLLTGNKGKDMSSENFLKYSKQDSAQAMTELKDSFKTILSYAEIDGDRAEEMNKTLLDFINLKDKFAIDDNTRALRRKLADHHYELYSILFIKAYKSESVPKVIDLFLKYGYVDERLLTKEQLLSLYFLKDETKQVPCMVYNIKEWLTMIYEGKKEPSKNEFDLEYPEMINGLKKQAKLTEKEAQEWLVNPNRKLEYEIQNMFRYNNRTTNGKISSFVPILHKDMLTNQFDRMVVSTQKVNDMVTELMRIDYSAFDREILYVNKAKNIAKEYIIKRVYPDIILMPTVGNNGVMWQEIAGKRRDSSGRFLLPIFTETSLSTLLVRVLGRFRWELCRSIEGTAWNDIKHKSLTSEYSDYLQYYRKNKELSEERKEKIKLQIQKGRNSSREIFVLDYEQWINYESIGAIKLNKPVRELMATYCPFSKEMREQIKLQPLFEEAMARYYREKLKKVREIEGRYRLLQKEQIELTPELTDALNYYKDL